MPNPSPNHHPHPPDPSLVVVIPRRRTTPQLQPKPREHNGRDGGAKPPSVQTGGLGCRWGDRPPKGAAIAGATGGARPGSGVGPDTNNNEPTPERDLKGSRPINYMAPNYSNTIVYKIKCKDPEVPDFHLGYSTFKLTHVARMFEVRCKHDENWPVCEFVRQHGGFENWCFERLPIGPCSSSLQARTELRKHFNADPPTLNKQLPTRTNKEYASGEKTRKHR